MDGPPESPSTTLSPELGFEDPRPLNPDRSGIRWRISASFQAPTSVTADSVGLDGAEVAEVAEGPNAGSPPSRPRRRRNHCPNRPAIRAIAPATARPKGENTPPEAAAVGSGALIKGLRLGSGLLDVAAFGTVRLDAVAVAVVVVVVVDPDCAATGDPL